MDNDELYDLFEELAEEWIGQTTTWASPTRRFAHPAYQKVIGLGPRVVPHILERLVNDPDEWFWALAAITRFEMPHHDNFDDARHAWLNWGATQLETWMDHNARS